MNFIIIVLLLVLSACALFWGAQYYINRFAERRILLYIKQYKKYNKFLVSDISDIEIKMCEVFPAFFREEIATSSRELRKYFIKQGYVLDDLFSDFYTDCDFDPINFNVFLDDFRSIRFISFYNGEPFREEDVQT